MITRTIAILVLSIAYTSISFAQSSSSASQIVQLQLDPAIEITAITSSNIQMGFQTANEYANGVKSTDQEFKVKSNQNFVVSVKTDANNFSYVGTTSPSPVMPVHNTLYMAITDNNTGGSKSSGFASGYASLSSTPKHILIDCKGSNNSMFAVNYKATPQNSYPAGLYSVNVIYTATQQ